MEQPQNDTVFISLGGRCEVAWQLAHKFGKIPSFPFDWLVTPLQSIPLMVEDDFCDIASEKYLEKAYYINPEVGKLSTVINTKYNIFLHHEFKRDNERQIVADWHLDIERVKSKFQFIATRWLDILKNNKIVFIRRRGRFDMPSECALPTTQSDFESILDVLHKKAPRCRLIAVDPCCPIDHQRIVSYAVGNPSPADWSSPNDYWKGATGMWQQIISKELERTDAVF